MLPVERCGQASSVKTPAAVQLLLPEMGGITGFYEARADRFLCGRCAGTPAGTPSRTAATSLRFRGRIPVDIAPLIGRPGTDFAPDGLLAGRGRNSRTSSRRPFETQRDPQHADGADQRQQQREYCGHLVRHQCHRTGVRERQELTNPGLVSTARYCGRPRHRQTDSVGVCSPASRRVATLRPRFAGLATLTPAPRTHSDWLLV